MESTVISYSTKSGRMKNVEVSRDVCEPFGFFHGERILNPQGKGAWVVGVCGEELWMHIDGDAGASFYGGFKKDQFEKNGFKLLTPRIKEIPPVPKPEFPSPDFRFLLESEQFCDVSFLMEDGSIIKSHRGILVARSHYFRKMFNSGMQESTKELIPLKGVDSSTFRQLLQFFYTFKVETTEDNVVSLMHAADLFQLEDLKDYLLFKFSEIVSRSNVWHLFTASDDFNDPQLKAACKAFILENWDQVKDPNLMTCNIPGKLLLEIMQCLKAQK